MRENANTAGVLADLGSDARYAVRSLRRTPGYTAVVTLTLALGIGAAVAAHAVIDPLLARPLPFAQPERLATLDAALIPGEYHIIREHSTLFVHSALYLSGRAYGISGDGEAERVTGARITPAFFSTLGVAPLVGVLPDAVDDEGETLILSYGLWQRRFGGATDVIGRTLRVDGRARSIVAVMPPDFSHPARTELWLAAALDPADVATLWGSGGYRLIARLREGATHQNAETQIRGLSATLSAANPFWTPAADYRADVRVISLHDAVVGDVRRALLLLGGAVALLLLIACANVANLVLARGLGRTGELAVRTALGASRRRITRQLVTETLVLASAGGAAGIALALLAVRGLRSVLPPELPRIAEIGIDVRVLAVAVVVTFLTGLVLGVLPARRATRYELQRTLRESGRAIGDRSTRRLSGGLVVAQVALAVLLASGAGLLGRSLMALQHTSTGMSRLEVVTARVDLPAAQYAPPERRNAFYDALSARLEAIPGVAAVALTSQMPFSGHLQLSAMAIEHVTTDPNNLPMLLHRNVTPEFFGAVGIPLRQGRLFTASDAVRGGLPVAIVDQAAVRAFWPDQDPIGKRLGRPWMNEQLTVIGVVGSVLDGELAGAAEPTVYVPLPQEPPLTAFVLLNTTSGMGVTSALRRAMLDTDANVPLSDVATARSLVSGTLASQRLAASLIATFGMIALALAAIGIYGVLAYAVGQRTNELALRLALGARTRDILGMVFADGMKLVAGGAALGLGAALASARLTHGMLHGVTPHDPATLAGVTLVVLVAAACAILIPARRASRVEAMSVLRG